jgi:hypothetical protein
MAAAGCGRGLLVLLLRQWRATCCCSWQGWELVGTDAQKQVCSSKAEEPGGHHVKRGRRCLPGSDQHQRRAGSGAAAAVPAGPCKLPAAVPSACCRRAAPCCCHHGQRTAEQGRGGALWVACGAHLSAAGLEIDLLARVAAIRDGRSQFGRPVRRPSSLLAAAFLPPIVGIDRPQTVLYLVVWSLGLD